MVRDPYRDQMTGNAGLHYAAWQLSRTGWHVMLTVRNARGSDMVVANEDETVHFGVQSKASRSRNPIRVRKGTKKLQSEWWILTIEAIEDRPVCFVLSKQDVERLAVGDRDGQWWINPAKCDEFREAWHRIGSGFCDPQRLMVAPRARVSPQAERTAPREVIRMPEQNGIRRPKPTTLCGRAWAIFDGVTKKAGSPASIGEALKLTAPQGLNEANVRAEFYRWRQFNGIRGRVERPKVTR
jgi:hypothetical protein